MVVIPIMRTINEISSLKGSFLQPRPKAWDHAPNLPSALKGPFTLAIDERPLQGRCRFRCFSQAFGLGCKNEPFRLKTTANRRTCRITP